MKGSGLGRTEEAAKAKRGGQPAAPAGLAGHNATQIQTACPKAVQVQCARYSVQCTRHWYRRLTTWHMNGVPTTHTPLLPGCPMFQQGGARRVAHTHFISYTHTDTVISNPSLTGVSDTAPRIGCDHGALLVAQLDAVHRVAHVAAAVVPDEAAHQHLDAPVDAGDAQAVVADASDDAGCVCAVAVGVVVIEVVGGACSGRRGALNLQERQAWPDLQR